MLSPIAFISTVNPDGRLPASILVHGRVGGDAMRQAVTKSRVV
jgi:hypothetical protein